MKRAVIANFYPVWPPVGGGQRRIFFLARELARAFDVDIVTPCWEGRNTTTTFGPRLREIRVAVDDRFNTLQRRITTAVPMTSDIAYALHWDACTLYNEVLASRLAAAAVAVTAHPYSIYPLLSCRGRTDLPIIFDSQNVELRQKRFVADQSDHLFSVVRDVETTAITEAARVIACSHSDAAEFASEYDISADEITVIENGVDALGVPSVPEAALASLRTQLGLADRLSCVFGGSFHQPNFRAVQRIMEMAAAVPGMQFLILGTVCRNKELHNAPPANVALLGEVDESTKWLAFQTADIGLNPMEEGSGTNIKMFEYAAAGLTVLSSPFGARGIALVPSDDFMLVDNDLMADALAGLSVTDRPRLQAMGARARAEVIRTADWSIIGRKYCSFFESVVA